MNTDGSRVRRLTNNGAFDGQPNWSPNGRKLSFQAYREGQLSIYTMRDDGRDQKRVTYDVDGAFGSAWSPDGRSIAHSSFDEGEIFAIDLRGRDERNLTDDPSAFDFAPDWQPLPRKGTLNRASRDAPTVGARQRPVTCKAPPWGCLAVSPGIASRGVARAGRSDRRQRDFDGRLCERARQDPNDHCLASAALGLKARGAGLDRPLRWLARRSRPSEWWWSSGHHRPLNRNSKPRSISG